MYSYYQSTVMIIEDTAKRTVICEKCFS